MEYTNSEANAQLDEMIESPEQDLDSILETSHLVPTTMNFISYCASKSNLTKIVQYISYIPESNKDLKNASDNRRQLCARIISFSEILSMYVLSLPQMAQLLLQPLLSKNNSSTELIQLILIVLDSLRRKNPALFSKAFKSQKSWFSNDTPSCNCPNFTGEYPDLLFLNIRYFSVAQFLLRNIVWESKLKTSVYLPILSQLDVSLRFIQIIETSTDINEIENSILCLETIFWKVFPSIHEESVPYQFPAICELEMDPAKLDTFSFFVLHLCQTSDDHPLIKGINNINQTDRLVGLMFSLESPANIEKLANLVAKIIGEFRAPVRVGLPESMVPSIHRSVIKNLNILLNMMFPHKTEYPVTNEFLLKSSNLVRSSSSFSTQSTLNSTITQSNSFSNFCTSDRYSSLSSLASLTDDYTSQTLTTHLDSLNSQKEDIAKKSQFISSQSSQNVKTQVSPKQLENGVANRSFSTIPVSHSLYGDFHRNIGLKRSLGPVLLSFYKILLALIESNIEWIHGILLEKNVVSLLLDSFFQTPWNNIVHNIVVTIIIAIFDMEFEYQQIPSQRYSKWFEENKSFNPFIESKLEKASQTFPSEFIPKKAPQLPLWILTEYRLHERIVDAFYSNEEIGYKGHLIKITSVISTIAVISPALNKILNQSAKWQEFSTKQRKLKESSPSFLGNITAEGYESIVSKQIPMYLKLKQE